MKNFTIIGALFLLAIAGCNHPKYKATLSKIDWGSDGGKQVYLYSLTNVNGMIVKISNYGAIVTDIETPDKNGKFENIVLGYDSLKTYQKDSSTYFGGIAGRYANRIGGASFVLDGKKIDVYANNGKHQLHGGKVGFNKKVWEVKKEFQSADSVGMILSYLSKDNEEGFPGNLLVTVTYSLTKLNELKIRIQAVTDKPTVLNLTNHTYFNLTSCNTDILNHQLIVNADSFTQVDKDFIPTGKILSVENTPYDFRKVHKIGERIGSCGDGYDLNYILQKKDGAMSLAAIVYDESTGREINVFTTQPGIQLYTGNYLGKAFPGSTRFVKHGAVCLETQHYPDSPNHPEFPKVVLVPKDTFKECTVYSFLVQ